jgi:hypothetical protein
MSDDVPERGAVGIAAVLHVHASGGVGDCAHAPTIARELRGEYPSNSPSGRNLVAPRLGDGRGTFVRYPQFHTDMSPGGYWPHTSVALATTPLLLKKIFMWLGQASHSGSAWGAKKFSE